MVVVYPPPQIRPADLLPLSSADDEPGREAGNKADAEKRKTDGRGLRAELLHYLPCDFLHGRETEAEFLFDGLQRLTIHVASPSEHNAHGPGGERPATRAYLGPALR